MEDYPQLLSCPFCGSKQDDFAGMTPGAFAQGSDGTYSINCSTCNCTGPISKSMLGAINEWNTRVVPKFDTFTPCHFHCHSEISKAAKP